MKTDTYDDIIHLSRPVSTTRLPMPLHDRAVQFAPFASLRGYDAAIDETARLTDRRVELDDETAQQLNAQIQWLREHLPERPAAVITFFVADAHKAGGKYVTVSGNLRRIDDFAGELLLTDRRRIALEDILRITVPRNARE